MPPSLASSLWLVDPQLGPEIAESLYHVVLARRPRSAFEVGTVHGGSARIIVRAMLDAGQSPGPSTFFMIGDAPRLLVEHGTYLADKGRVVPGVLPQALELLPWIPGGFDFVFVDGEESDDAMIRSLKVIRPRVGDRAVVAYRKWSPLGSVEMRCAHECAYAHESTVAGLHIFRVSDDVRPIE